MLSSRVVNREWGLNLSHTLLLIKVALKAGHFEIIESQNYLLTPIWQFRASENLK